MLVSRVYLHEQRKQSFLTLAKENQSPLGLDKNLPTFLFTNPRFVLLIHALRFLFSPRFRFLSRNASSSARTSWAYHSKMKWDIKKKKMSSKNAWICYRGPLFTPRSYVRHVLLWMRTLYLTSCGHPLTHCNDNAWKSQGNLNLHLDLSERIKSYTHTSRVSTTRAHFNFWVN